MNCFIDTGFERLLPLVLNLEDFFVVVIVSMIVAAFLVDGTGAAEVEVEVKLESGFLDESKNCLPTVILNGSLISEAINGLIVVVVVVVEFK
jgi:hypothetical protein